MEVFLPEPIKMLELCPEYKGPLKLATQFGCKGVKIDSRYLSETDHRRVLRELAKSIVDIRRSVAPFNCNIVTDLSKLHVAPIENLHSPIVYNPKYPKLCITRNYCAICHFPTVYYDATRRCVNLCGNPSFCGSASCIRYLDSFNVRQIEDRDIKFVCDILYGQTQEVLILQNDSDVVEKYKAHCYDKGLGGVIMIYTEQLGSTDLIYGLVDTKDKNRNIYWPNVEYRFTYYHKKQDISFTCVAIL